MYEDNYSQQFRADKRAARSEKARYGPGGGTRAAQAKRDEIAQGHEGLSRALKKHLGITSRNKKKGGSKRSSPSFILK